MKTSQKSILLSLALVATFALNACGNSRPTVDDRLANSGAMENVRQSYEGVIEKAAVSAYTPGTHRIIADDGAHLIQSSTINLNQYEGKEVMLSGLTQKGPGDSEIVLNVDEIELLGISFQAPFIDYESQRYDFALKHPETWEVKVTDLGSLITFDGQVWVNINVYNNQSRLETFVPTQEDAQGVEVTVAHQRAIRFNDTDSFRLYVEHPPTDRIYRIRFDQVHFSNPEKQPLFYRLLESFEFLYSPKVEGPACGGEENLECEEGFRCEVASARSDAEGICVSISGPPSAGACPYIAPPGGCNEYRVEEYNANGCPFRYECLEGNLSVFESVELDEDSLISAEDDEDEDLGPEDDSSESDENEESEQESSEDDSESPVSEEIEGDDSQESDEESDQTIVEYTVPSVESVTGEYKSHSGFSVNYPKSWWFYNFGADGIGFAPSELQSIEDAVMVLKVGSGDLTTDVNGVTYGMSGPSDLSGVMQAILDSVEVEGE